MAEPNKAIGLRLNPHLWRQIKEYGLLRHPGDKSKEGFDVTQTITELLAKALEIPLNDLVKHSSVISDERIAAFCGQEIDRALTPVNDDLIRLNARLDELVDEVAALKTSSKAKRTAKIELAPTK
jgi:hypothetical protein